MFYLPSCFNFYAIFPAKIVCVFIFQRNQLKTKLKDFTLLLPIQPNARRAIERIQRIIITIIVITNLYQDICVLSVLSASGLNPSTSNTYQSTPAKDFTVAVCVPKHIKTSIIYKYIWGLISGYLPNRQFVRSVRWNLTAIDY